MKTGLPMNARELEAAYSKLSQLFGTEGAVNMADLPAQLENAVINPAVSLFDERTAKRFQESRLSDGSYKIENNDSDLIQNIKAVINIMRSFNHIHADYAELIQHFIGNIGVLKTTADLARITVAIAGDRAALSKFHTDMMAFIFYIKKINELLPSMPQLNQKVGNTFSQLKTEFENSELNQIIQNINAVRASNQQINNASLVANIGAEQLIHALDNFGLKTHVEAVCEMTAGLVDDDGANYNPYTERYLAAVVVAAQNEPNKALKLAYNYSRDIKKAMTDSLLMVYKIIDNPLYNFENTQWQFLSAEARADYIKLSNSIKIINANLVLLQEVARTQPDVAKLLKRDRGRFAGQLQFLNQWQVSGAGVAIDALDVLLNPKDALDIVQDHVEERITESDKNKYFNQKQNIFIIPAEDSGLSESKRNLFLVYNITAHAQAALGRINNAQNHEWSLGKIPDALAALQSLIAMVGEFSKLNQQELVANTKEVLQQKLDEVMVKFSGIYNQAVMLAIETEIKLDLKENALLQKLQPLEAGLNQFLERMNEQSRLHKLEINFAALSRFPFVKEREAAVNRAHASLQQKRVELQEVKQFLAQMPAEPPYLPHLFKIIDKLKLVNTYEAYEYTQYLETVIAKLSGQDILENNIQLLELQIMHSMANDSLLNVTDQQIEQLADAAEIKEALNLLRYLYVYQAEIKDMLAKIDAYKYNPAALARVNQRYFNVDESRNIVIKKIFGNKVKFSTSLGELPIDGATSNKITQMNIGIAKNIDTLIEMHQPLVNNLPVASAAMIPVEVIVQPVAVIPAPPVIIPPYIEQAAELRARNDAGIIHAVIDKAKGTLILTSEASRAELITNARKILSVDQARLLDADQIIGGRYDVTQQDHLLVVNVKAIANVMLSFDQLMWKVTILQNIVSGGFLGYYQIPNLIGQLKANINSLLAEINLANDAIYFMRSHLENGIGDAVKSNLTQMLGKVTELPAMLAAISGDMQLNLMEAVDHEARIGLESLVQASQTLSNNATTLVKAEAQPVELTEVVRQTYVFTQSIIPKLAVALENSKLNADGTYDLAAIPDNTAPHKIAALYNAAFNMRKVLGSVVKMSEGHNISGFFSLITHLLQLRTSLNAARSDEMINAVFAEYELINKQLNDQLASLFVALRPMAMDLVARAAFTETVLGLQQDTLLQRLKEFMRSFIELGLSYKVEGFVELQAGLAEPNPYQLKQLELARLEGARLEARHQAQGLSDTQKRLAGEQSAQMQLIIAALVLPELVPVQENLSPIMQRAVSEDTPLLDLAQVGKIGINANNLNDPDAKVLVHQLNMLNTACVDYKHHLATSINTQFEKYYPNKRYVINLENAIDKNTMQQELAAHPKLRLAVKKYNIVHSMQTKLHTPATTVADRLNNFQNKFENNRDTLVLRRDTGLTTFLKVLATVFSFGIAAAFGLWGKYGKGVANKIDETIHANDNANQPKSKRIFGKKK
jgi:hypothetical protein